VTQFSILAAVARLGEASLKQLEDELAIDQTTLTRSLTLLERDGVLERASHPTGASRRCGSHRKETSLRCATHVGPGARQMLRELGAKAWLTRNGG